MILTVLFRRPWDKYFTPSTPIEVVQSESFLSVWIKTQLNNLTHEIETKFTVLLFKALPRYFIALDTEKLQLRSIAVTVFNEQVKIKFWQMNK
jgi:hypothetical protein